MFTLIADHSFGNGTDFWSIQSSSASVRKSTRRYVRSPGVPVVGFWLIAYGGFGFSPAYDLVLRVQAEPLPGRTDEPIRLGSLALSGAFARVRLAVSF